MRRFRTRLRLEVYRLRGTNAKTVVTTLNPILRGWAAYFRSGVSKRAFNDLDNYLWWILYRWALRGHSNKSKKWIKKRYFGRYHPTRQDQWIFGDRDSGLYMTQLAWTPIVRHIGVYRDASPDDPSLTGYWEARRRKHKPPLGKAGTIQLYIQRGRCPLCRELLLHADKEPQHPDDWAKWFTATRRAIRRQAITIGTTSTKDGGRNGDRPLVHASCARRHQTNPHGRSG